MGAVGAGRLFRGGRECEDKRLVAEVLDEGRIRLQDPEMRAKRAGGSERGDGESGASREEGGRARIGRERGEGVSGASRERERASEAIEGESERGEGVSERAGREC